jgi:hypothetical protein
MRAHFGDIFDWLVNADISDFCRSLPCVASRASHDYLLPLTERDGGTTAMLARKDDNTIGKVPREKGW